jgi:hypothetical protein
MEVQSISFSATQTRAEDISAVVSPPTVELIDDADGKAVLLFSLAAMPAQAQANADGGLQLEMSGSLRRAFYGHVSPAAGQTVRILIQAADASTASLNKPTQPDVIIGSATSATHVKVFNVSTGALLWSRELTNLTPGLHTVDINRDELPGVGNSDRLQVYVEVVLVECRAEPGLAGVNVYAPTFQVIDNLSGRTTVRGGMWPMKESMETMKKAWKDAS